jgi:hypothetical protein
VERSAAKTALDPVASDENILSSAIHASTRRLRRLAGLDLIAMHRKGVPGRLPYYAWRLTTRGFDVVAEAFPEEPYPDGLAERLADGSLHILDHRGALTPLYLGLSSRPVSGRCPMTPILRRCALSSMGGGIARLSSGGSPPATSSCASAGLL